MTAKIPYLDGLAAAAHKPVFNGGLSGNTSTQIKARFDADTAKHSWPTVIWAGRNDFSTPSTVLSNIAAMVAALGHDRYLVVSVLNSDTASEYSGGADYDTIIGLNESLASTYGEHYVDVRSHLVSLYDSGNPTDVTDHDHDVPPSSLRSDSLHLNTAGYQAAAAKVGEKVSLLGFFT